MARPVAIAGSRHLIDIGDHREAVFWIIATASRCQSVLTIDAPAPVARAAAGRFAAATADLLGVRSSADLHQRVGDLYTALPDLEVTAAAIRAAASHHL